MPTYMYLKTVQQQQHVLWKMMFLVDRLSLSRFLLFILLFSWLVFFLKFRICILRFLVSSLWNVVVLLSESCNAFMLLTFGHSIELCYYQKLWRWHSLTIFHDRVSLRSHYSFCLLSLQQPQNKTQQCKLTSVRQQNNICATLTKHWTSDDHVDDQLRTSKCCCLFHWNDGREGMSAFTNEEILLYTTF